MWKCTGTCRKGARIIWYSLFSTRFCTEFRTEFGIQFSTQFHTRFSNTFTSQFETRFGTRTVCILILGQHVWYSVLSFGSKSAIRYSVLYFAVFANTWPRVASGPASGGSNPHLGPKPAHFWPILTKTRILGTGKCLKMRENQSK